MDWVADILEVVSQRSSETESDSDHSAAPEPEFNEPIEVLWDGRNWQEMPDEGGFTISNSEPRLLGTKCPICQEDYKTGQIVKKYRLGHAVCRG